MRHRTDTKHYIRRGNTTLYSLPITAKAVRRFSLMQEDCIVVHFSMASAPKFDIGDYIDDELFGRFYVTKEQMPKYNTATGGYDYELTLEAAYRGWNNWLLCLVADGRRMESTWTLTDRLQVHADQIVANLDALGLSGYTAVVTAENAAEAHCITYSGKHIIDAMTMIADEWGCEWWVDESAKTIHFGKCEASGNALDFILGGNVASMDIANNRNAWATRLYAYGGTQNIPETYDRRLIFENTQPSAPYGDINRPLTSEMLQGIRANGIVFNEAVISGATASIDSAGFGVGNSGWLRGTLRIVITGNMGGDTYDLSAKLVQTGTAETPLVSRTDIPTAAGVYQASVEVHIDMAVASGSYNIVVEGAANNHNMQGNVVTQFYVESDLEATYNDTTAFSHTLAVVGGDTTYAITFAAQEGSDEMLFTFDDNVPPDWGMGTQYIITDIAVVGIPLSYYSPEYDTGVLSKVGERRLHLPLIDYPNRCLPAADIAYPRREVEMVALFDKVFPRLELEVTEVNVKTRTSTINHDDGTTTKREWTQYSVKARQVGGAAFNFDTKYMLNGGLEINFTAPQQITPSEGYRLAGMTFEAGFAKESGEGVYTVIRNENYGVELPNAALRPMVGDTFILTGWNPNFITALGLVTAAEEELAQKAAEYMAALEEGNFTFTCRMMSDWPFLMEGDRPFHTSEDEPLETADGAWFYVTNGYDSFRLPIEGAKVTIHHGALGGTKTSRVIGYEFKLDMPWDSPTYTIGETQAYSRLAKIEKEITNLSS